MPSVESLKMSADQPKPLAYDAYQDLAEHYAAHIETKPHNAYYDRPAMVEMWPELEGRRVLDAGCGPGIYTQLLLERRAVVTAIDMSDRMLELARRRLGADVDLRQVDMSLPLDMFESGDFSFVNAPLCLDYIEDWRQVFAEFGRILQPGGLVQFSCGHPSFDAEYYHTTQYFSVEQVECTWKGFGKNVVMPSYRRSFQDLFTPLIENGFQITKVVEPLPTDDFKRADPKRYLSLMQRPAFICIQATRV